MLGQRLNLKADIHARRGNEPIELFRVRRPNSIVAPRDFSNAVNIEKINEITILMLVHTTAYVVGGTDIGVENVLCARIFMAAGVNIGEGCIISSGITVPPKTVNPYWI